MAALGDVAAVDVQAAAVCADTALANAVDDHEVLPDTVEEYDTLEEVVEDLDVHAVISVPEVLDDLYIIAARLQQVGVVLRLGDLW